MINPKISIVLSTIRPNLWIGFIKSLLSNTISYEVIFVGNKPSFPEIYNEIEELKLENKFYYIYSNECPAKCYQMGFNFATGELIHWSTDDCEYSERALDKAYEFYKSFNNYHKIIAFNCIENGSPTSQGHRLDKENSPLMAPLGMMNRRLSMYLGGYDKNFYCGQAENDLVMRTIEVGGSVEICKEATVYIEHNKKHGGKSIFRTEDGFPYHQQDREYLMKCWRNENNTISNKRLIPFDPFIMENNEKL